MGVRGDRVMTLSVPRQKKPVAVSSDGVVEIVRDLILSGGLDAGAPIRQDVLAEELGVSKIPVREALYRLTRDGLVYTVPNRGFFVSGLSPAEAYEVYDLRLAIEPSVTARAALAANEADRKAARSALDLLNGAVSRNARDAGTRHRAFHNALIRPADRNLTGQIVERLLVVAERYVRHHLAGPGRIERANEEHGGILDAWLDRDALRVERLVLNHIGNTMEDLKRELASGPVPALE